MEPLKHSAGNSFRQTIESEKLHLESQKKSISQKVINKLYDLLLKFGSIISTSCDEKLEAKENPESGEITFDGQIEVSVVIKDVSGNRSAVIPVAVIDSNPNIEPDAVNKLIENAPINESKVDAVSSTPKISVDLSKFKLTDDDTDFLKVSHEAIGNDFAVVVKKEEVLEAVLKQSVLDETRDWNADVEFTGTFVKPEIPKKARLEIVTDGNVGGGCPNPSEPLEVVDNDLTTKFKSADSYNQNIERDTFILSQKKQRLQDEAANHIYKSLISLGYNPVKIVSSEAIENKVVVKAEFFDGVTKLASFDYLAEKVADEETIKLFNETAKNATIKENIEEQLAAETSEKLKEIDKYSEWHTKTTEAALEKDAGSLGVSNTPQLYQYQPLVRINKAFLPDVLKEGDIIPLNGRKYKIVSLSDGQLSKELNSGSLATLEMIS